MRPNTYAWFAATSGPMVKFCSFQDCLWVWKWGLLFEERRGFVFLSKCHICCTVISQVYPHPCNIWVREFVLYGHCTSFIALLQWIILMQDIHGTSGSAVFCQNLFCHSKMAVTWKVLGPTITKFKPLILPIHGFSLSSCMYIWICIILDDFCLFPA
jgi:hypothetical protein